jgi:thiamine-phosphate pyrophosphorylase
MKLISKLHFITTNEVAAEQACRGGVNWIQLRLKDVEYEQLKSTALKVQEVCKKYRATFIINDDVQLAWEINADGVHLGKEDMAPDMARAILGDNAIIGCTANTFEDIIQSAGYPIDYIGLGPFRFTATKKNLSPVLGVEGYKRIINVLKKIPGNFPVIVGIGGITVDDIPDLAATGLSGIAVSGAIGNADDIAGAARTFITAISDARL